ncbi:MAG: hypothetical protein ACRDP6_14820 [Actinoallomurus sp.]
MPLIPTVCPACSATKEPKKYLCRGCWFTLPRAARGPLLRHDAQAFRRLSELLEQIRNDVPLNQIQITIR